MDVDTCARKQVESTQDPVQCGAVQCAPGPIQSKRPRQLLEISQDRYRADRGRACALGKRRVKEEEQSQTKAEKAGGRAVGHCGKGLTVSKYLGTCPRANLKNPPRWEGEGGDERGWGSKTQEVRTLRG